MARDINRYLDSLKARRTGVSDLNRITATEHFDVLQRSLLSESYQKRSNNPYTTYALGAMQEVGPDYTKVSIDTAERVKSQLATHLSSRGWQVDFRLQGSVPCNIHIRGVSDVDLLVLDDAFHTYDILGVAARSGTYQRSINYTPLSALTTLRKGVEEILTCKFYAAEVDCSGSKAVKISGGSLRRPVDVVPSHWHDTIEYQRTWAEHNRGVYILDKSIPDTVKNLPFLHIKEITDRDEISAQGLKKAIRLCKNVKSDAIEDGKKINLSSFDIASAMYHSDMSALRTGQYYELAILAEAQRHLDHLAHNHHIATTLWVPDGTRLIFDNPEKLTALNALSVELDDLLLEVAKEQDYGFRYSPHQNFATGRETISKSYIPFL